MLMKRIKRKIWFLITQTIYKIGFHEIGKKSLIYRPLQLDKTKSISIGNNVFVAEGAWLMGGGKKVITLRIGDRTTIGHFSHIIGLSSLTIEKDVLIADRVFISDNTHNYEKFNLPILYQGVSILSPVVIGEGSWICENVCICGASIGKHCVIGANSVVTRNIPDYCVAVGSPAKVIKKYDFESNEWKQLCDM